MKPWVRVATKMYNEADFIEVFLAHYLGQGADEVVLFDDGSDDDTVDRAARAGGPRVRVERLDRGARAYDLSSDEALCGGLFETALRLTDGPTWWLFPDVDELIRPGPDTPGPLANALRGLEGVDGVPCVGLHCLPREPEDPRFTLPAAELLAVLHAVSPPRSFEPSHRGAEAWKTPVWFFGPDASERYRGLRVSSGTHVLLGDTTHLRYARPAWPLYHYKVRRVAAFLDHARRILDRVPADSHYRQLHGTIGERVAGWGAQRYRVLRLAPVLTPEAVETACRATTPPGVYHETPFRPGVWGYE